MIRCVVSTEIPVACLRLWRCKPLKCAEYYAPLCHCYRLYRIHRVAWFVWFGVTPSDFSEATKAKKCLTMHAWDGDPRNSVHVYIVHGTWCMEDVRISTYNTDSQSCEVGRCESTKS